MTRTQLGSGQIKGVDLGNGDDVTGTLPVANGGTGQTSLTALPLTDPVVTGSLFGPNGRSLAIGATASAVNYFYMEARASGSPPVFQVQGTDTNIPFVFVPQGVSGMNVYTPGAADVLLFSDGAATDVGWNIATKNAGTVKANGVPVVTTTGTQTLTNKTVTALATTDGIAAVNLPNGLTNGNTSAQSQLVVSGTSYYIAGSNLNLPASLKAGMAVGTRFRWRVAMAKTNAGTGAFAIEIRRGTAGTVADTADVSQSIGTQTAAVDSMVVDVEMVVTTTGATGAYYWTIIPVNKAVTATGFGVATGATGQFSGTVSSVAMNTASLIFGLSFKATTGTPTVTIPMVQSEALKIC